MENERVSEETVALNPLELKIRRTRWSVSDEGLDITLRFHMSHEYATEGQGDPYEGWTVEGHGVTGRAAGLDAAVDDWAARYRRMEDRHDRWLHRLVEMEGDGLPPLE